jgi:hypothetical protein
MSVLTPLPSLTVEQLQIDLLRPDAATVLALSSGQP